MFYILSLFWILSVSGLLVLVFKKKFGFTVTLSFLAGTLILYLFGFINKISWGFYCTFLLAGAFWIILLLWFIRKEKEKLQEFSRNYFTFGFFAFLALTVYAFVLFFNQGFTYCDEFTHWGPMVIATLKCNGFYAQPDSLLTFHKDYPPFFALLEVLWCGFRNFEYSETSCYMALGTFMFSCFLPVFDHLNIHKKKDIFKAIVITASIVLVGITLSRTFTAQEYAFVYNSIYTDWSLAVFTSGCLFMIYKEKEWTGFAYFFLSVSLSSVFLMKQMGICFYLIILFYAFIKILFVDKALTVQRLIKGIVCFAVLPFAVYFSWQYIIKLYELQGQFVISELQFSEVLNIARGNTEYPWKTEAYVNFLYAIVHRPLIEHPIGMSYVVYVPVIMVLMSLILKNRKDIFTLVLTYFIGACGYALTMLLLYMLAYNITEAPGLASFDRYMSTYLYIGTTLTLLLAYDRFSQYESKKLVIGYGATALVLCLLIEPGSIRTILPKWSVNSEPMKVLVINQYGEYKASREDLNGLRYEFKDLGYVEEGDITLDEFKELLQEYDLIYVYAYDDYFYYNLWLPLEQDVELWNENLYMINKTEDGLVFTYQMQEYYDFVLKYYLMEK